MLSHRTASPGYWTVWLLPIAIALSGLTEKSIPLLLIITINTLILCAIDINNVDLTVVMGRARNPSLIAGFSLFSWYCFHDGVDAYFLVSILSLAFAFPYFFYNLVRYYPKSFTFGEALIVTQGFTILFGHCTATVPTPGNIVIAKNPEFIILFTEAGFLGVMIACRLLVMSVKPWTFLFTEEYVCLWGKCCLAAMGYRLTVDDFWRIIFWLLQFLGDRIWLFLYCAVCCAFAGGFVYWKNRFGLHASTTDRKYFHFLIVAVYLPGILVDREFLYLGSAATMYILVLAELVRCLKLSVFGNLVGDKIEESVSMFRDQQDEGKLIVTPLYLMAGCSMPIWLLGLNVPTSKLNGFQLTASMAGLLSIGVGDTFASIGGTAFGHTRWRGTHKSFSGTIFCLSSQIVFIWILFLCGIPALTPVVVSVVILTAFVNSLVEALTDQIDNLVLPLVTYDLILVSSFLLQIVQWART